MASERTAPQFHAALIAAGLKYAALSWEGFNIYGDSASIAEVMRLLHEAGTADGFRKSLVEAEADLRVARDALARSSITATTGSQDNGQ